MEKLLDPLSHEAPLKRHAVLLDGIYRYQRHVYDFTRKYYLVGRDRLIAELEPKPGETLVEIGCGTARNLIQIARLYPNTTLFGVDASPVMLATARTALRRAGLTTRVCVSHGFAETLSPEMFGRQEKFDHAIFSYSLSLIPDWRRALSRAAESVKSEGVIHIVDFGDFRRLWRPLRYGLQKWLSTFHVTPRAEFLAAAEGSSTSRGYKLKTFARRYAFVASLSPTDLLHLVGSCASTAEAKPLKGDIGCA